MKQEKSELFIGIAFRLFEGLLILLVALILISLLSSCSSLSLNSGVLLQKCDKPMLEGKTYRDAVVLAVKRGQAIDECNLRIDKIRELND